MTEYCFANTLNGLVKGVRKITALGNEYYCFQKIPYAKPPINELRFSDPVPVESWSEPIDGTVKTPACIQFSSMLHDTVGVEDCLYLNIYTKNMESTSPVMVWFHGGGFMFGSSASEMYGPDYLLQNNIILVTVNYRLGIFGFASFEEPSIGIPGNAGLRDQLLAMKWIKNNINNFGGDENNITVFGESAGANSVHYLMLSPNAENLFQRAILMSGTAVSTSGLKSSNNYTLRLAEVMGFNMKNGENAALEFLRLQNAKNIIRAQEKLITAKEREELVLFPFGPIIEPYATENSVIPQDPSLMLNGAWSKDIDLMIGGTSDEGLVIYKSLKSQPDILKKSDLFQMVLPSDLVTDRNDEKAQVIGQKLKEYYYGCEEPSFENSSGFLKLMSDKLFLHRIHRTVSLRRSLPGLGNTFLYRFSVDSPTNNLFKLMSCGKGVKGCSHADDISYVFKNIMCDVPARDSIEFRAIQILVGVLTKFATDGNPNDPLVSLPNWEPVSAPPEGPFKCFNIDENGASFFEFPETERLQFWDSIYSNK